MKKNREISFSESYTDVEQGIDYRKAIHPRQPSPMSNPKPYYQLFEEKNGFIPNLSIIDLLFSQGPQSKNFL